MKKSLICKIFFSIMAALFYSCALPFLLLGLYLLPSLAFALFSILLAFVLGVLCFILFTFTKEFVSKDRRPPVVGSAFSLLFHFNHLFDFLTDLSRKQKTFRFISPGNDEVYTADPVNVEYILRTNFVNYGKGERHYEVLSDLFGDGIFAVDGEKWRHQRKLASLELSTKKLRDFSTSVFRSYAVKLAEKLSSLADKDFAVDLQDILLKSTLDSIFKVGFGAELDSLSGLDESGTQFSKAVDESNFITYWRYVDLLWKVKRFLNISLESELRKNIKVIDNFIYKLISYKRDQMKYGKLDGGKGDILSRFLIESEKDPSNMTDKYLRDITLNFLIAGRDTSANTLTWFFYMLCQHPMVYKKVVSDVCKATDTEHYSDMSFNDFCGKLTEEALDKMHYLHSTLTETMRLYPAVPVDGKIAQGDDILPDGLVIKKGEAVTYMAYPMGRMTYIWGENAEEFLPERWIENGLFRPESPFKFTAFQAGPRICLGKDFAYRQMKILAAVLVNFFEFKLADQNRQATYRTINYDHSSYARGTTCVHTLPRPLPHG